MTVTVGVVDDGSLAFRGVVEVLNGASDVTLVGVFPSLGAVLALEVVPDVLITDRYCADAAQQVRQARQFVACPGVLVVSGSATSVPRRWRSPPAPSATSARTPARTPCCGPSTPESANGLCSSPAGTARPSTRPAPSRRRATTRRSARAR